MQLNPAHLAEHVTDAKGFDLPWGELPLPNVFGFQITKFMVLEVLWRRCSSSCSCRWRENQPTGQPAKGRLANLLEMMVLFIRNEIVRPAIGRHDAERYLPLVLTLFFFILFCNLMGLVPWLGSPTASISTTAPLALIVVLTSIGSGMKKFGAVGFGGQCPHMELPPAMKIVLVPMVMVLEIVGMLIRHCRLGRASPGEHVWRSPGAGGHSWDLSRRWPARYGGGA